jgi:hypothetical protein
MRCVHLYWFRPAISEGSIKSASDVMVTNGSLNGLKDRNWARNALSVHIYSIGIHFKGSLWSDFLRPHSLGHILCCIMMVVLWSDMDQGRGSE